MTKPIRARDDDYEFIKTYADQHGIHISQGLHNLIDEVLQYRKRDNAARSVPQPTSAAPPLIYKLPNGEHLSIRRESPYQGYADIYATKERLLDQGVVTRYFGS